MPKVAIVIGLKERTSDLKEVLTTGQVLATFSDVYAAQAYVSSGQVPNEFPHVAVAFQDARYWIVAEPENLTIEIGESYDTEAPTPVLAGPFDDPASANDALVRTVCAEGTPIVACVADTWSDKLPRAPASVAEAPTAAWLARRTERWKRTKSREAALGALAEAEAFVRWCEATKQPDLAAAAAAAITELLRERKANG